LFFDVTDDSQIKNAVSQIRKHKKSVDVLVNVAGIAEESTNFQMTSLEKMKRVMEANFFSATIISQYVSRLMVRQQYGTIANITSIAGLDGEPAQYEYASSKAALIGATKNLARELAPYNIRVNAVAPGMIETKMGWAIDEKLRDHMLEKTIMRRMGTPDEVANVVAFLASNLSSYMTGQVIRIDGGV
jgi:3-oxoacyl-[acyl-carrier protein] reductase